MAPGSSGSALIDGEGRLLGLNTNRVGGGFYLAIPTDAALQARVAALGRGESTDRPRLGVGLAPAGVARRMRRAVGLPERDGALVRDVAAGSPAEAAGITLGDLIVRAGGSPVADADDLADALAGASRSGSIELVVVRGTDERAVTVTLATD
jgi:serine protease Do